MEGRFPGRLAVKQAIGRVNGLRVVNFSPHALCVRRNSINLAEVVAGLELNCLCCLACKFWEHAKRLKPTNYKLLVRWIKLKRVMKVFPSDAPGLTFCTFCFIVSILFYPIFLEVCLLSSLQW